MREKNNIAMLQALFKKQKVLDMTQLCKALGSSSRVTAFRYLQKMNHLTSYTHDGKYYTIPEIVQFDPNGFWYYDDIGFSSRGTLVDTLAYFITMSESGKTNAELEMHFRTRVQNALRTLLNTAKIARIKPTNRHLYVNPDPIISSRQIQQRVKIGNKKKLPDWIVVEILVETIRSFPMDPAIDIVVNRLSKRRSLITYEQVKQVFEENDLEKKTLD
jgi:hypothetical protein